MKALLAAAAVLLLCPAAIAEAADPPALSAVSAILVDGESGRVLFAQNADREMPIASTTKLMTCLVAAETGQELDTPVTILPQWTGAEGSSIYLKAGEAVTLEELLYGLMLASGNDAALAVAGHCGGDVGRFVAMMNGKAVELGMTQTRFSDPSGLADEGHYSTARDMALLARACLENETVAAIVSSKSAVFGDRVFTNHNKLLWRCEGCVGMKTGYTKQAGRTLVSAVERDGRTLVAVTLNAPDDWNDHAALYEYGFARFRPQSLCEAGKVFRRVPVLESLVPFVTVTPAEDLSCCVAASEQVRAVAFLPTAVRAPVEKGDALGTLSFFVDGMLVGTTELVVAASAQRERYEDRSLLERVLDRLRGGECHAWAPAFYEQFLLVAQCADGAAAGRLSFPLAVQKA